MSYPLPMKTIIFTYPQGRVVASLNAWRSESSYGSKLLWFKSIFLNNLEYMISHDLSSSMRIRDTSNFLIIVDHEGNFFIRDASDFLRVPESQHRTTMDFFPMFFLPYNRQPLSPQSSSSSYLYIGGLPAELIWLWWWCMGVFLCLPPCFPLASVIAVFEGDLPLGESSLSRLPPLT